MRDSSSGSGPSDPSPAATSAPAGLEDERKYATALHCAVADAAAIVERVGSIELQTLIRQLLAIGQTEIAQYDGVIIQRHTDGFVAIFGAQAVHEDDGRRAILAALAIQRQSAALALDLRIGIDAGPLLVCRAAGAGETSYTAVGDAIRVADLLHQFAAPGAILISQVVWRAVDRHIAAAEVSPAPPGQRAYRVTGRLQRPAGVWPPRRTLVPFIGREQETAILERLGRQALDGSGQVVSIVGEPGMGKSRLVYEFTRALARGPGNHLTLEGRCVSYGSLIPYLPLVDLLRAHCLVDDTDPPDVIRDAVEHTVRENGLPPDATGWLLRLLGIDDNTTAAEPSSPEAVKARTFEVLRLLFLKASARQPLVIVVEDLHWIDRTSEEFITTLVERLTGARVLLAATQRHGYRAPWLDRTYASQITLSPLTAADSARLVSSIAAGDSLGDEVSRTILSRGEGNPFFLEELARTVIEHGAGGSAIPETVQGVIMARLDRLPDGPKQLLQTAAVLGREVPLRQLARLSQRPDLERSLADLCRQEFMYERTSGDEPVFVFKHALTQDVAYDSLLSRRRRELHLEAARALEDLYTDRLDEMTATLAYHYARTDLIDQSVTWLVRAAERAARVYANAEAILHLDLAARRLQRLPEGPERDRRMLDVALRHAHSLYFLGRFRESVDVLLPHEARLSRLADAGLSGAYAFWLAHMYSRLGDQRRAAENAHRAIEAATEAGDNATLGKAHGLIALEGHWSGQPSQGIAHGTRAIELLQPQSDQRWWLGMTHFYLAMNHLLTGRFDAALEETARADAVGKEIGDPRLQTYAGFTAGWVEALRGRTAEAIDATRRSLDQAPDRVSRAYATMLFGYALLEHGDHVEALQRLQPIIAEFEAFAFPQWHALTVAFAAEALRHQGRLDEAASLVERALQVASAAEYWYAVGFAQRTAGRIARDHGHAAEAAARLTDAAATFDRIGAAFEAARCQ